MEEGWCLDFVVVVTDFIPLVPEGAEVLFVVAHADEESVWEVFGFAGFHPLVNGADILVKTTEKYCCEFLEHAFVAFHLCVACFGEEMIQEAVGASEDFIFNFGDDGVEPK